MDKRVIICLIALFIMAGTAGGEELYVPSPYPTIQAAVDDTHGWVPSTDTWSVKDVLPAARHLGSAATNDYTPAGDADKGYFFCGSSGVAEDDVYVYTANTPSDDWQSIDTAPSPKFGNGSGAAGV